jgi:pimeloyl-ACP methyl ester carboxylesterase
LFYYDDVSVHREIARAIANLAVNAPLMLSKQTRINDLLRTWLDEQNEFSKDLVIRSEALRALSSLGSAVLESRGPRFSQGVYLLYPQTTADIQHISPEFDIVLIHGITGDPFGTWRVLKDEDKLSLLVDPPSQNSDPNLEVWPRDWIPETFPNCRIISVGYEMHYSKWLGDALPLEQQSIDICRKLSLAGIGKRPIIWITHSYGGILVKQLLQYASQHDLFTPILTNSTGIVFFSTPHHGAQFTKYTEPLEGLLRGTPVVDEIKPNSINLNKLNEQFPKIAPHIITLNFGENDKTCIGSPYTCFQLVSDESANPGWAGNHKFYKLNASHRETCKPKDKNSFQYVSVIQFIEECKKQMKK